MQIIIFGIIAFVAIFLQLLTSQGYFNVSEKYVWKQTANILSHRQPVQIKIPSANIDAAIERVGVDVEGKMQAPTTPKIVSWYQFGGVPGDNGNVVLSGHKDSTFGPGVFYTLENIKPGNPITVMDAKENTFTYYAKNVSILNAAYLPIDDIFSDQKKEKNLYLITCAGRFDIFKKSYDERVLIKAQI